ncbi:MAG: Xaa-Pro dipeptidase [Sinobacteraceae bacterium]|nr:Xaa-Pro dipeptidase [Nevskiaceae bacterium]
MCAELARAELSRALDESFGPHLEGICARTAAALEACGFGALLVHSGSLLTIFEDDRTYPFAAHAPFKVWLPVRDAPESFVFFQPGHPPMLLFHSPPDYWYLPATLPDAYWTRHFTIRPIMERSAARAALPRDLSRVAYIGDQFAELAQWGVGAVNPADLMRRLDYPRARKSAYELVCMREANRLGALGHAAAAAAFQAGASEFEIELAFLRACGLREQELPYNPIIALNEGGAVLHYQLLAREPPAQRRSMLIDAGAEFACYASDITRTYAATSGDFAELIRRMDQLQQSLCAGVHHGVDWRDVHLRTHELTAHVLRDADLIRCDAAQAVERGVTRVFMPHGVGHLLGIEVHDVGGFLRAPEGGEIARPDADPNLRLTRVLETGFVVTMEPGLYFIDQLLESARADGRGECINWQQVQRMRGCGGIRIEDNLAITANGCENLTRASFAALH